MLASPVSDVPPLPAATVVAPGVESSGRPREDDLVNLLTSYDVHALVALTPAGTPEAATAELAAAARSLGMSWTRISLTPDGGLPVGVGEEVLNARDAARTRTPGAVVLVYGSGTQELDDGSGVLPDVRAAVRAAEES